MGCIKRKWITELFKVEQDNKEKHISRRKVANTYYVNMNSIKRKVFGMKTIRR